MRVFKNKAFAKWAAKEGLSDEALLSYSKAQLNKAVKSGALIEVGYDG